jgi:hypothetical protein
MRISLIKRGGQEGRVCWGVGAGVGRRGFKRPGTKMLLTVK